jgi:catalase
MSNSKRNKASRSSDSAKSDSPSKPRGNVRRTAGGAAATPRLNQPGDAAAEQIAAADVLAAQVPFNASKSAEYDPASATRPRPGQAVTPEDPLVGASTVTESNGSEKTGSGSPIIGKNNSIAPLDRVRADASGRRLTTNQGVPIGDNQNSLKAGLRGPTLLEDFILREKITHFDHERIPERIVHARGSAAHGYFECTHALQSYTRASVFAEAGKQTPVFVRFSTVVGERGSADTVRDVRGFAVKFYTDEGNWDLVGNNIPIFFIQDAMKFPDLVHAAKPEPHYGIPQAATAHDTFWDFASLMPEITAMLMWAMSDRAIPRSYRTMQGFGVNTYRLVNADGESHFVKFHWTPMAGTHSLVWDEALKICGADPDFHRRDLWEAIEAGAYPEWELGLQIITEDQAESFTFDVLDATKIVPEELVPIRPVGRLVLNRNPDNFFAETEQVAFCTAHVIPGIDFSNDPLLAGRIHSYVDTQISRLGGPNFHEIPINAPLAQVHNNQRDGMHRQAIHRGRVAYEPNSLAGGCPFQAGSAGFVSFPEPLLEGEHKVRGKPERFADHYTQATLFWNSQTPAEKVHIVNAFRFELSKVQVPAVRTRMVSGLRNVAADLAEAVAAGLGISPLPEPMPKVMTRDVVPEVTTSPALSLSARPGSVGVLARRVAILLADGVEAEGIATLSTRLTSLGAVPKFLASALGTVTAAGGESLAVDARLDASPAVLFDAVVLPDGADAVERLAANGQVLEFLKDQYRHCKPLLAFGAAAALLDAAGIPRALPSGDPDPGILHSEAGADADVEAFLAALARHRIFARETEPPRV